MLGWPYYMRCGLVESLQFLHGLPQHFGAEEPKLLLTTTVVRGFPWCKKECKSALLDGLPVEEANRAFLM